MVKTLPPAGRTSPIFEPVLNPPGFRRHQRVVGDLDLVEARVVCGGFQRVLGSKPGLSGLERRIAPSSGCLRWSNTSWVLQPFCTREPARSISCCARICWLSSCATLALASSIARGAWRTCACAFFSEASRSRVSMVATTWPALTM